MKKLIAFFKEEDGLELSEYAVMAFLIAITVIATVTLLGERIDAVFNELLIALGGGAA